MPRVRHFRPSASVSIVTPQPLSATTTLIQSRSCRSSSFFSTFLLASAAVMFGSLARSPPRKAVMGSVTLSVRNRLSSASAFGTDRRNSSPFDPAGIVPSPSHSSPPRSSTCRYWKSAWGRANRCPPFQIPGSSSSPSSSRGPSVHAAPSSVSFALHTECTFCPPPDPTIRRSGPHRQSVRLSAVAARTPGSSLSIRSANSRATSALPHGVSRHPCRAASKQ